MAEVKEVKLYGAWGSGYCAIVHHALRLKGVAYEYVEEDLQNKSEALLGLNPVHKKVPVLVLDGKPVSESLVILEFVEETWKEPPLLPEDPYKKAKVRFFADFIYQKIMPISYAIILSDGEAQVKATEEFIEHMSTLEKGIQNDLPSNGPFINGEKPGLLDVIVGACSAGFRVLADLVGVEVLDKEKVPLLHSSVASFIDLEVIKDTAIPYEKLLERVHTMREKALASTKS
ncbi:glutathione S-transferase U10 isoform X1 [Phoenix dactylifera]|uniref:Glutathione S-transferase n=1 Tax=Phoenix dactylifera TaxID=42345 RepID=A0A8B7CMX6_PHODC|nr:glutathione S-transferase U10 isoform X1 [Phoenix dactylifera]